MVVGGSAITTKSIGSIGLSFDYTANDGVHTRELSA